MNDCSASIEGTLEEPLDSGAITDSISFPDHLGSAFEAALSDHPEEGFDHEFRSSARL